MKTSLIIALLAYFGAPGLRADFTYEQSSAITGGKVATAYINAASLPSSKMPLETETSVVSSSGNGVTETFTVVRHKVPANKSTIMVQGNRMVTLSREGARIADLDKETITEINYQKRTYSVITFKEMAQARPDLSATKRVTASVKDGGQSKMINGLNAKLMIATVEMESAGAKSGQKITTVVASENWIAPSVPGFNEVTEFEQRLAEKITGGLAITIGGADLAGSFQGVDAEIAKLDGTLVFQVTRVDTKEDPNAQAKRKNPPTNEAPEPLAEVTIEKTSFAQTADPSKFEVPAGFKQVRSEITQQTKKN